MAIDPIIAAAGVGLTVSPIVGRALLYGLEHLAPHRRKLASWLVVAASLVVALSSEFWLKGVARQIVFILLLAAIPGAVAYMVWRTALASALVSLVPLYYGVGPQTLGWPIHVPEIALDRVVPLQPAWMFIYGSLFVFVLLPLLIVRDESLFRRTMKAYILVLSVAYAGFVTYPTVAPRPERVLEEGFLAWCLRLQYSLDSPYNCFPSLHVAHSFVSALACFRVHKGVGLAAVMWASLIGVSTLFTKQHYVVDVVSGALIGFIAYILFLRTHPRETISPRDHELAPRRALGVVLISSVIVACFWILYLTYGERLVG